MKRLRWQILVVVVTLVVVAVLLVAQQPVGPVSLSPQPTTGGVYTEALVGSMGRLNPMLDWNNSADRDIDRLLFSGLIRFDERGLPRPDLAEHFEKRGPLGRAGRHEELANLAAFLVSDMAGYITGDCITIDGGRWVKNAGNFSFLDSLSDAEWDSFRPKKG